MSNQPAPSGAETITQGELLAELRKRFGDDPKAWAFVCPSCGDVASATDFRVALDANGRGDEPASNHLGQVCIGRILGALKREQPQGGYKSRGCDWAAFGLFSGPMFVIFPDGRAEPSFRIADALASTS
jgi:hypothetical protein